MALRYDEVEVKQPKVVERRIVQATCDRCGKDALCSNAPGGPCPWGRTWRLVQGSPSKEQIFDLCRECSEALDEWVDRWPRD